MAKSLDGKVALVTGGSRGIGRAISLRLARDGARVVVNYATQAEAAGRVVDEIRQGGGQAMAVGADVSKLADVRQMVERVVAEYGGVDVLVNNAGLLFRGTSLTLDEDELDRMFAVNVKGIVHCVKAVAPLMAARHQGRIINIASIGGLGTAVAETTPYAATKAAVVVLTKRQALELGPDGIAVNAVCPGFIRTEMLASLESPENADRLAALNQKAMLGRIGVPEDVAGPVAFLAGADASFITGQILTVDGGRMDFLTGSA